MGAIGITREIQEVMNVGADNYPIDPGFLLFVSTVQAWLQQVQRRPEHWPDPPSEAPIERIQFCCGALAQLYPGYDIDFWHRETYESARAIVGAPA